MTTVDAPSAVSGEILGDRYRLDEQIGEGGMARVYRAEDLALQRTVAVKIMRTEMEAAARRRARMETSLLAALTHPSVVTVYDAHIADDGPSYIVMEYVRGRTLRDRLDHGPLTLDLVAALGMDLAEALHAVHDHGVVHRDLKPSNVLLWPSPLPDRAFRAKLTDFGIACLLDATRVTSPGMIVGTAAYLAPEQVRGESPAPAADVYSLGLVLLEALTARPAFGAAVGPEAVVARLTTSPAIPDNLPDEWRELLIAMTAANPTRRPTALQVAVACSQLRAPTGSTGEQLRALLMPWEDPSQPEETEPRVDTPGRGIPSAATEPRTEPLPIPIAHAAPHRGRRAGALAAAAGLVLASAVGVGLAISAAAPVAAPSEVGLSLGAQLGQRFDQVAPAEEPAPAADTAVEVAVVDRPSVDEGVAEEASGARAGNENRGPGNNSGSGSDSNSGKGGGNGNSGSGNGNSGKGSGNSGKGGG